MTDINQELERIATESFYDDDTLDEATDTLDTKGNPRQPTVGAAPAQKEDKISNVTDVLNNPPTDWGDDRREKYLNWAKKNGYKFSSGHVKQGITNNFSSNH